MSLMGAHQQDIDTILSHRYDLGADYWTTPDHRLLKGAPFSALESISYLLELGVPATEPIIQKVVTLLWKAWQPDGRFKLVPTGGIYPCQTAHAAALLCRMGYAEDSRLQVTLRHFLETSYDDGGWRCNKFSYGRGPETEYSTPHTTLLALNAFRFSQYCNSEPALDAAVETLLSHWDTKAPISPCHYGIGSLFMQVEYPFRGYNLFHYVYVLSHYNYACRDKRFKEALAALQSKLIDGQIIVERVVPKLAKLSFCQKGKPSALATKRFDAILHNIEGK